jgi:asparagine synthase (glutamine-hydrolysing)
MDQQPYTGPDGIVVCLDGRLDNFHELMEILDLERHELSDCSVVAAAFARWGEQCFARFTGDWAVVLWCARDRTLFLARDHAGTRSLYFEQNGTQVRWGTYLDTFLGSNERQSLSLEYGAAYLSCSPIYDLTPYANIRSVLPGHYVAFRNPGMSDNEHWNPTVQTSVRYKTEAEYDEHFLYVFERAVSRRTGPGAPILAQLSGGMDSTAIVCMSDRIRRAADPYAEILDTISFFDDSEASLDERRYFSITEQRRGKAGVHLDIAFSQRTFESPKTELGVYRLPGADSFSLIQEEILFRRVWEKGYRSILSGIGGDEVLGGVPNGIPELADYFVAGRLPALLFQAVAWALPDRRPLAELLYETARYTSRLYLRRAPQGRAFPSWLRRGARTRWSASTTSRDVLPVRRGIEPHRLDNALTWWRIMDTLPHLSPQLMFRPEYRYPMLDKDLVEYVFSIPPDQLVRPGRRRAMMRRALRGIVPMEILERRRKAFQHRAPLSALRNAYPRIRHSLGSLILADMGLVEADAFWRAFNDTINGAVDSYHSILRAIAYELWLQGTDRIQHSIDVERDEQLLEASLVAF